MRRNQPRGASAFMNPSTAHEPRRSLAAKFIVSTGFVLLVVFSIVTMTNRSMTEDSLAETVAAANAVIRDMTDEQSNGARTDVEAKADRFVQLFASVSADAIVELDLVLLGQLVKIAVDDGDIVYVEFLNKEGKTIAKEGVAPANDMQKTADISQAGVKLGLVRIGYGFDRSDTRMRALEERSEERYDDIVVANAKSLNHITLLNLTSSVIAAFLIGLACVFLVNRHVRAPLQTIMNAAANLAQGNLKTRVTLDTGDELGLLAQSFNSMANQFSDAMSKVQNSSTVLASTATEVAAITEQSSQGLLAQEKDIGMVATAMHEMTATVSDVSKGAQRAAQFATQVAGEAAKGKRVVDTTIEMINSASRESERSASVLKELGAHSQTIGSVVDVIKSIAEQTNLLALNASIEAARAGEQGRGFAVVADEVRVLAKRTQESTSEIERMIAKLQTGARDAVQTMEVGRTQVNRSVEQAREAGASLEVILKGITEISDVNIQIASSSEEQLSVVEELHRNVSSISRVAEESAKGSQQTAQAAEGLERTAQDLAGLVEHFKI